MLFFTLMFILFFFLNTFLNNCIILYFLIFIWLCKLNIKKQWYKHTFYTKKKLNLSWYFFSKTFSFKFGSSVIFLLQGLILSNFLFLKFKLFLKKMARKAKKSLRKFWLTPHYVFNVTLKSKGSRMGKGKGKHLVPLLRLYAGKPFLEIFFIRFGRLFLYTWYFKLRLNTSLIILTSLHLQLINFFLNKQPTYLTFLFK